MDMSLSWETVKDREAWCAVVHGVTKSWTWLNDWTTTTTMENSMEIWRLLQKRKVELRYDWTSLVAQWIRIHLPMQGTQFDPWSGTIPHAVEQLSLRATTTASMLWGLWAATTEPMHRNEWSPHAQEPTRYSYGAGALQLLKPKHLQPVGALQPETPPQWEAPAPQGRAAPALHN